MIEKAAMERLKKGGHQQARTKLTNDRVAMRRMRLLLDSVKRSLIGELDVSP